MAMTVSKRYRSLVGTLAIYLAMVLFAIWSLLPVAWVVVVSLKPNLGALSGDNPFDFTPRLDNYVSVLTDTAFPRYFLNTLKTSLASTVFSLLFGLSAAYGLARFRFRANAGLLQWFLSVRLVPTIAFVVPFFILFKTLQLLDTSLGLIIVYTAFLLPFSIWLLTSFIKEVPVEAEEASLVDGCNRLQSLWRVLLPQIWPAIGAVALLNLVAAWNEFLLALILTSSQAVTLPVAVSSFLGERGVFWGEISAVGVLTMFIPIALSIAINRYLVRGLTLGTLK
jgi:multiple sugar transport system permease protein